MRKVFALLAAMLLFACRKVVPIAAVLAAPVAAQAQGALIPYVAEQFLNGTGVPAVGYKLCGYKAGTTTLQNMYTDVGLTVAVNPAILSTGGLVQNTVYVSPFVAYKYVLHSAGTDNTCSTGTILWTRDNVTILPNGTSVIECADPSSSTYDVKVNACEAALPTAGGVLNATRLGGAQTIAAEIGLNKPTQFLMGAGTFTGTLTTPLINITNSSNSGTSVIGLDPSITTLIQAGVGDGIDATDGTEIVGVKIANLSLNGSNIGAKAIYTNNCKDCKFLNFNISGFLNHSIDFDGVNNLNNDVNGFGGRITPGSGALSTGRGVNARLGNQLRIENTYFNFGGTFSTSTITGATNTSPITITTSAAHGLVTGADVVIGGVLGNTGANGEWIITVTSTTQFSLTGSAGSGAYTSGGSVYSSSRYLAAIDGRGVGNLTLHGNIYDGVPIAVISNSTTLMENDYIDLRTNIVQYGYLPTGNNAFNIVNDRNANQQRLVFNPNGVSDKYISYSNNDGQHGAGIAGSPVYATITPTPITADQNNYAPVDNADANQVGQYAAVWYLSTDTTGVRKITGFGPQNPGGWADGKVIYTINTSSGTIQYVNNSGSSTVGNRLLTFTGADEYLAANEVIGWEYRSTLSAFREIFHALANIQVSPSGYDTYFGGTFVSRQDVNGGNGRFLLNTPTTDFSSGILVSKGTIAVVTSAADAKVLALNASGGNGKSQIVATSSGAGVTQPLELFVGSTLGLEVGTSGSTAFGLATGGVPAGQGVINAQGYQKDGSVGLTVVKTVTSGCTITFTGGLMTGSTC